MKIRLLHSFLWVLLIIIAGSASADDWAQTIERFDAGHINWTKGTLVATGEARLAGTMCEDKIIAAIAREKAHQQMLAMVDQLRIDATTRVWAFVSQDPLNHSKIVEMVENARCIRQLCLADDRQTITLELSLRGGFAQFVLPAEFKQVEGVKSVSAGKPVASQKSPLGGSTLARGQSAGYTGLIVDARNIDATPALAPRIFDEHGRMVYGSAFVSREFAVQQGVCGYTSDPETARHDSRIAGNPLMVKALRSTDPGSADMVISNAEAARIRRTSDHLWFLRQCRVLIIVDPMPD